MPKSRVQQKCPRCDYIYLPSLNEKQSRAGKSSRRKGANFELKVAKDLKKWWPGGYDFKRTPMSGGSQLKEGFNMAGDVCTNAPDWRFHIECKNSPNSFTGLHNFFSNKSKVWKWLTQAKDECPLHKIPMLVFNRFDQPTFCATNLEFVSMVLLETRIEHFVFNIPGIKNIAIWQYKDMLASNPEGWK